MYYDIAHGCLVSSLKIAIIMIAFQEKTIALVLENKTAENRQSAKIMYLENSYGYGVLNSVTGFPKLGSYLLVTCKKKCS